jgi:hypothetical protein
MYNRFFARFLPVFMLMLVLVAAAFAFANTNTVEPSGAGDGSDQISGYNVTAIRYTLDAADPSTITAVRFTIAPLGTQGAPDTVKVQLNGGGSWYDCTNSGARWTCPITGGMNVAAATQLRVIAVQAVEP